MRRNRPRPACPDRHGARRPGGRLAVITAAALVLVACGGGDTPVVGDAPDADDDELAELSVAIASFDISAGEQRRLMAGVFSPTRQLVAFGEVEFGLAYLGEGEDTDMEAELDQRVTASFLGVPGIEPEGEATQPTLVDDTGSGVYAATVDLERPGIYGLQVAAELDDGSVVTGQQAFTVTEHSEVPDVGDEAPAVDNFTIQDAEDGLVEPVAVDSRAQDGDLDVLDPRLHSTSVADALDAGRPVVVTIATPVYCQTRFCGPLTEVVADLADDYADRADFVHLEVWEDFDEQQLNDAAAAWIQTEFGGNEPWVFLVDEDGRVAARWDNVLDVEELVAELDTLPTIDAAGS